MSQVWCSDVSEIRMVNSGYPVSHWNLKSHGNAQVYKMSLIVQLLVGGRRGAGAPAEQESVLCPCSPEGSLLTGLHWAGPDQQVQRRNCSQLWNSPAELLRSHTPALCETNQGIQHWGAQVGGGSSTWGCTKDCVCKLRKSRESIIAAFNQL